MEVTPAIARVPTLRLLVPSVIDCWLDRELFRRLRWAGHVARMAEGRSAFKILTNTPEGEETFKRGYA